MLIGITGSFGCGKTVVAKMFTRAGFYVIDADKVYHSLIRPGRRLYKKIVRAYGAGILKRNSAIDRRKLAGVVFRNKKELVSLNKLVHPELIKEIDKRIGMSRRSHVVIDAALLVESGFYQKIDNLVLVKCRREKQISRLIQARGLARKDIMTRIKMQSGARKKAALADFIIDNSSSSEKTLNQVRKIWKTLGVAYDNKRKIRH